jgi:transcriptional regulator with XRE-family HTH domain
MPVYSSHLVRYEDLDLGGRIREQRQRQGLKLKEVAARVNISAARLSEIETGRHVPDLRQVLALADALSAPADLFLPVDIRVPYQITRDEELRTHPPRHVRVTGSKRGRTKHQSEFWPLADLFIGRHLEPTLGRILPDTSDPPEFWYHHEEEFDFVLKGTLEFLVRTPQGICRETLRRGDCVFFRSDLPHSLRSLEAEPAEVILVLASTSASVETGFDSLSYFGSVFAADEQDADLPRQIGERLRALREARAWTVEQLASVVGLTERQLGRIEEGARAVPMNAMLPLARALGKPLGELLGRIPDEGPYYFVQRSSDIARIPTRTRRTPVERPSAPPSKSCRPLARGFPARHMFPYLVSLLNVDVETLNLHEHHGHEFIYVLDGELEFTTYAEDKRVTEILRPGDSCYLDCSVPHLVRGQTRNPFSETSAEVIDVFWSPLGESYLFAD